jgi:hypothetical protein
MAKVIERSLRLGKSRPLRMKRAMQASGKSGLVRIIDVNSPTLVIDITGLFQKNVAKARRANAAIASKTRTKRPAAKHAKK